MKQNQFWNFKNSADTPNEATLYIYGDIMQYDLGWWNWPDDVIPHRFRQELTDLGDVDTIHVRINSNGGSVFGAYAIMNLLKSHKATIITYNDGIAASAGTIIAMAGDRIVTALGSVWMVHLPAVGAAGNVHDLQKAIDILNVVTESMLDIYQARTGIDRDTMLQMMNDDTWLTGKQAVEKGFADEVSEEIEVDAYLDGDMQAAFFNGLKIDLGKVQNKDVLVAMLGTASNKGISRAGITPQNNVSNNGATPHNQANQEEESVMSLEDLKAKHPDLYNAAFNAGVEEGVQNERARIAGIDALALPGMEDLTNDAIANGITAEQFAVEIVKAQRAKGTTALTAAKGDAKDLDGVGNAGAPQDDASEEEALLAMTAEIAKNIQR